MSSPSEIAKKAAQRAHLTWQQQQQALSGFYGSLGRMTGTMLQAQQQSAQAHGSLVKKLQEVQKAMLASRLRMQRQMSKQAMFGVNYAVQGGISDVQPIEALSEPAPTPCRWRAVRNAFEGDVWWSRWWTYWLIGTTIPHTVIAFVDLKWWAVAYLIAGVAALFRRGRLAVNDWKNQQLALFNGTLPKEPLDPSDTQVEWMTWIQHAAVLVGIVLIWGWT